MKLFKFEIVETVYGSPDPSAFPVECAHTPSLAGSSKLVLAYFSNKEEAVSQEVDGDDPIECWDSVIWKTHSPQIRSSEFSGGLDVYFIGEVTVWDRLRWWVKRKLGLWTPEMPEVIEITCVLVD